MRIISFITDPLAVRDILAQRGEPIAPAPIAPARGPPLRETAARVRRQRLAVGPVASAVPAYEFDQRIAW
jgi:hypothetical protein